MTPPPLTISEKQFPPADTGEINEFFDARNQMFTEHKIKGTLDLLDMLKGLYRKNERGYRLKPKHFRS